MGKAAKIELPGTPPSKNTYRGKHWAKQQEINKKWENMTIEACETKGFESLPEPIGLHYTFLLPDKRHRDLQNFVVHGIQDGIVKSGLIEDDSVHYIQKVTFAVGGVADNEEEKTIIRFQSLNDRLSHV